MSVWSSVWAKILWLHWHSTVSPCRAPTSGSSLDDSVTVLGGTQKPDHFVVYMSLDPPCPRTHQKYPQRGTGEGVRDGQPDSGARFRSIFSQTEPLGTIRAQLTKAMTFLPASHSCLPLGRRSLVRLVRWDPLGEGATTDPGLAFCSPEEQWRGGVQTEERWTLFPALGVYSPTSSGKAPPLALRLNSSIASLPSSFAKIRTLKEISSTLDQGMTAFSSPSVPGDLAATQCHQDDFVLL